MTIGSKCEKCSIEPLVRYNIYYDLRVYCMQYIQRLYYVQREDLNKEEGDLMRLG